MWRVLAPSYNWLILEISELACLRREEDQKGDEEEGLERSKGREERAFRRGAPDASSKAFEFANATLLGLGQAAINIRVSMVGQHRDEGLRQVIRQVEVSMSRADVDNLPSLLLIQLPSLTHVEKGAPVPGTDGV